MSKNICSVCGEEFEDKYFDKEDKKCVLHCDKSNSNKEILFWEYFNSYIKKENNKDLIEIKDIEFPVINNRDKEYIKLWLDNAILEKYVHFIRCRFQDEFNLTNTTFENEIVFSECNFYGDITFDNCNFKNKVAIEKCTFNKKNFNIKNECNFFDKFIFMVNKGTLTLNFELLYFHKNFISIFGNKDIDFNCEFQSCFFYPDSFFEMTANNINKLKFSDIHNYTKDFSFDNNIIKEELSIYNTDFKNIKLINLNLSECKINIESVSFLNSIFIGINWGNLFNDKFSKSNSNREFFREIKYLYDNTGNIIEANNFYALEMKEREKELTKDLKEGKNFFEWLVFKVHGISSNHSQDWLLALFWILSLSFGFGFIDFINKYLDTKLEYILIDTFIYLIFICLSILIVQTKKINNFWLICLFYLIYGFITKDFTLFKISNHINPFSVMDSWDNISFSELMYKITIAYLIYQLIISIRQNTRRK
ncbi:hypothetical protein CRV00_11295 [Malaciobacter molluscorum]|uniref:pentapeptide repeat-containing protein n=1 Tax=Malaciobacter molluscorum TaxID=1032072 RepID=UPI00100B1C6A|nr:pentapeptide repeat-containing protein [Malaciobacter molluscorum]RXJ93360.1 hypothetical protein CRV00_11295 [Malaciobacter molluscorum]